jgi:hypothetical protein
VIRPKKIALYRAADVIQAWSSAFLTGLDKAAGMSPT